MFLYRVALDVTRRETMRLLSSPEYLHGAIEKAFPPGRVRKLWRIDALGGQTYLLVLSPEEGNFTQVVAQYGFVGQQPPWESKPYQPLLSRLAPGQIWQFRLVANPVRAVREGEEKTRGKVMAHVTSEQQKQWLLTRADQTGGKPEDSKLGFSLSENSFEVVATQWYRFHKGHGHQVTLRTAAYEGSLQVTDPDKLALALTEGIGRAKAYGCGLLTLSRGHSLG